MLSTPAARRGMVTAPHHLAAQSGLAVLRDGGNAIEAMVAAAATIAVVYPHMNSLGGDGFWIIRPAGGKPIGIDACGTAGSGVTVDLYREAGHDTIPMRGPLAANTVGGTVAGWAEALSISSAWGGRMPLSALLADAIHYARSGIPVTDSQAHFTAAKRDELASVSGFADVFLPGGAVPRQGDVFHQPAIAATLARLAGAGLDDFYRGDLAQVIAKDLDRAGSPITAADLAGYCAQQVEPLTVRADAAQLFNMIPPTQGLISLLILAIAARLDMSEVDGFDHIHGLIEATKCAFDIRDNVLTDPAYMTADPADLLSDQAIANHVAQIDSVKAMPWPKMHEPGDTIWMGAVDGDGNAVSFIQSIYWEFGSGVVLKDSGMVWQNRGASMSLEPGALHEVKPGRRPFHTLNPAMALFDDGRTMVYGTMGGDGQPQTQAAVFSRYAWFNEPLQRAVTAPRWLLGRTWGDVSTDVKMEAGLGEPLAEALRAAGHQVRLVPDFDVMMGHAGAIVLHPSGVMEGATDPRANGVVAAF